MKNVEEEWFVFLKFAQTNLGLSLRSLNHARAKYPPFVQYSLLRDAVLSYSRSFRRANAKFHPQGIKLDRSFVSSEHIEFHTKILNYRDKVFAHTDLDALAPQLIRITAESSTSFVYRFSPFDREPLHFQITGFEHLINSVSSRIERELAAAEAALREKS